MRYFVSHGGLLDMPFKPKKLLDYLGRCPFPIELRAGVLRVMGRMIAHPNIYFKHHLMSLAELNTLLDKSWYGNIYIEDVVRTASENRKEGFTTIVESIGRLSGNGVTYAECFVVKNEVLSTMIRQKTIDEILATL